jgi:hypothetical protein
LVDFTSHWLFVSCYRLSLDLLAEVHNFHVRINGSKSIKFWKISRLDKPDFKLFEFFLNLRRHQNLRIFFIRSDLVLELNLIVTRSLDSHTNFEVAWHSVEFCAIRVA